MLSLREKKKIEKKKFKKIHPSLVQLWIYFNGSAFFEIINNRLSNEYFGFYTR
ncbi:hypothetical protein BO71DRAFT_403293 [Aspergillus ellipticus CBS 707.79]|uniref:Uncharacterized protein n=1 Tax=Aspergillus ellipticus CBS 707.79 TaxID=1448320 RepID=A0A319CX75_9EURO|nr:hypothetical protein BO71DRAFT_403293 [Aspergillus ellipticus CBS 707.79]